MARVIVQTDDGKTLWQMERIETWHLSSLQCPISTKGSALAAGIRRAVEDAEAIREGRDPERPSEKAMRLSEKEK